MNHELRFRDHGPFTDPERDTIRVVHGAMLEVGGISDLLQSLRRNVDLIDQLGEVLAQYPSLFTKQSLGRRRRDLSSLVDMLSESNLSNFEMFLPTRALLGRTLIMAQMNFFRFLRFVCDEAIQDEREEAALLARIDIHLSHTIHTRLAGELFTSIASDEHTARGERRKAVLALLHVWERVTYRLVDYLSVLRATWEARRRVSVTGGTLMGTTEVFQLLQAGCDERFVTLLVRPEHTADEAAAFREFLFGTTTEELARLEEAMASAQEGTISLGDLDPLSRREANGALGADPALALFEFFLARHLQAAARRQAGLPGPKRTAEEYVMLHYLESQGDQLLGESSPA